MEVQFTKGQWKITGKTVTFPTSIIVSSTIDDGINEPFNLDVCHVLPKIQGKEANAKLIAAAPEMIEALQWFVDRCDKGEVRSTKTYNRFKEIIKKATE